MNNRFVVPILAFVVAALPLGCGGDSTSPSNVHLRMQANWWEVQDQHDDDCIYFHFDGSEMLWVSADDNSTVCQRVSYTFQNGKAYVAGGADAIWPAFSASVSFSPDGKMVWSNLPSSIAEGNTMFFWNAQDSPNCSPTPPLSDCQWITDAS